MGQDVGKKRWKIERAEKGFEVTWGTLPSNGLPGMYRWMVSHFHYWTDYNEVAFSGIFNRVTRMGSQFFETLRARKSLSKSG